MLHQGVSGGGISLGGQSETALLLLRLEGPGKGASIAGKPQGKDQAVEHQNDPRGKHFPTSTQHLMRPTAVPMPGVRRPGKSNVFLTNPRFLLGPIPWGTRASAKS